MRAKPDKQTGRDIGVANGTKTEPGDGSTEIAESGAMDNALVSKGVIRYS